MMLNLALMRLANCIIPKHPASADLLDNVPAGETAEATSEVELVWPGLTALMLGHHQSDPLRQGFWGKN